MATYLTIPIQNSPTVAVEAAAEIDDVRGKAIGFDANGKGVLATDPSKAVLGIAILTSGDQNRLDGKDGYVASGAQIDVQVQGQGYALVSAAVKAGDALTVDANGCFVTAAEGNFVVATALRAAAANTYAYVQMTMYCGAAAATSYEAAITGPDTKTGETTTGGKQQ